MTTQTPETTPRARTTYPLAWLRAVAAVAVLTFHAYQHQREAPAWTWPWSGPAHQAMLGTDLFVDLFFVLSGLVLWLPVTRSVLAGETGRSGRSLLYRRMARLVPLYFAVVLVVWALTNPSLPGHWQDLLLHLTFTHIYSDEYIFWTDGPAWSLAVEFHFYVLVALAVPVVTRLGRRAASRGGRLAVALSLPLALVVVGLAYLAWSILLSGAAVDDWSIWFNPLSRAADFGVGMLLAVAAAAGVRLPATARRALALIGLGAVAVLVMQRPFSLAGEWWHPLYATAIAVGLASIVLTDGPWPAWMSWRPLAWLGGVGYGVYLIHEPVMRLAGHLGLLPESRPGPWFLITAVIVAVPTVALAWLSSRTVEVAGLRLLATLERDGSPRDYYPHLTDPGPPPSRRQISRQEARVGA